MADQPKIRLKFHEHQRISALGKRHWFPRLFRLSDGTILQNNTTGDDTLEAVEQKESGVLRRTIDGGATWQEMVMPPRCGMPVLLPDGNLRSFNYRLWPGPDNTLCGMMSDLPPGSNAWTKEERFEIYLPRPATAACLPRGVQLQPDGSLLAALYGKWSRDHKDSSYIVNSDDNGRTWHYRSTIAGGGNAFWEGFNEPVLCRTADNALLCVMRTGSGYPPLHSCRSEDNGFTWSKPRNLGTYSVSPDLCLMSNGILVCSFGRPWIQMTFSLDGNGNTWTDPVTILASRGNSTCYTGVAEAAPGRLALVYDQNFEGPPWLANDNYINSLLIDVEIC
ncbi:MAG: sialidase family protein [Desulfuromonadaceae bacterium]|nr:sialidase family protein [Desulfuromonadaceae bacterium]